MCEYKVVKISVKESEEEISRKLCEMGKEGWELVNFQPSSESPGLLKNNEPWTTFYIFVFKK